MLRRIEHLLKPAMVAVESLRENNSIKSGYQGAISAFGASVMQMGLLPTLAVYSDADSGAEIDRKKLLAALHRILKSPECNFSQKAHLGEAGAFLNTAIGFAKQEKEELEEHILLASVALKLAIRTFKLD